MSVQVRILGTLTIGPLAGRSPSSSFVELVEAIPRSSTAPSPERALAVPSYPQAAEERREPFYAKFAKRGRR